MIQREGSGNDVVPVEPANVEAVEPLSLLLWCSFSPHPQGHIVMSEAAGLNAGVLYNIMI